MSEETAVRIGRWLPASVLALVLLASPGTHAKDTGLIFVSNEKSNNLIVLDPKTYQVVKEIRTSRRPRDMHFSADRTRLYVACGDDDVIDILEQFLGTTAERVIADSTVSHCASTAKLRGLIPGTVADLGLGPGYHRRALARFFAEDGAAEVTARSQ